MPPTSDIRSEVRIAGDGQEWAHEAAALIHALTDQAIAARGRCLLALSGGSTPKTLYQTLTRPEWKQKVNWKQILFCFGDERCIPPDHPESTFGMTEASLFRPLDIDPQQIYRMKGEIPDPMSAACEYEDTLRRLTGSPPPDIPQIDLILLGLGDDGHTASLFPGTSALHERTSLVTVGEAPKGVRIRLTVTLGVINRASVVLFLVTGSGKAPMVRAVLEPRTAADQALPAAMVKPVPGQVMWMLDRSAASQLTRHR